MSDGRRGRRARSSRMLARLRRHGGAFDALSTSPALWYDPSTVAHLYQDSALTTPVTTTGNPVGGMLDISGNNRTVTQATGSRRPAWTENVANGLGMLKFTAANTTGLYREGGVFYDAGAASWLCVLYFTGANTAGRYFAETQNNGTASEYSMLAWTGTGNRQPTSRVRNNAAVLQLSSPATSDAPYGAAFLVVGTDTGSNIKVRLNGVQVLDTNYTRAAPLTANRICLGGLFYTGATANQLYNMYAGDTLGWARVLTGAEISNLESLFAEKWGISL